MRRWLANLTLLAVSLAACLGGLELAARWLRARPLEPVASRYTGFDPLLGWRHRPGLTVSFPQGDYRINALGLRDRERAYAPAAGTLRLLVLGDSFAEGFSVAFEDSVSQVLERSLSRPACPTEVIAAGTVGYSTDQELLFFREAGRRFQPKVVVLLFYYNDIVYNGRASVGRAPKPLLKFHAGDFTVVNAPLTPPAPGGADADAYGPRSAALAWLGERLLAGAPRLYDAGAALGAWRKRGPLRPGSELLVYARDPPREVQDDWEQTVQILRALRRLVEADAGRLLVVYVPSKMEVEDRDWQLTQERYDVDESLWDRGRVARMLRREGQASGYPVLDLTAVLRRQQRAGFAPYHEGGGHWNAVGHGIAALAIEDTLRSLGWLPACR